MEELTRMFKSMNNRGKSAIVRYILDELDIDVYRFKDLSADWTERKLVDTGFGVNIQETNLRVNRFKVVIE